jgi:alanine dehydrogenase
MTSSGRPPATARAILKWIRQESVIIDMACSLGNVVHAVMIIVFVLVLIRILVN